MEIREGFLGEWGSTDRGCYDVLMKRFLTPTQGSGALHGPEPSAPRGEVLPHREGVWWGRGRGREIARASRVLLLPLPTSLLWWPISLGI